MDSLIQTLVAIGTIYILWLLWERFFKRGHNELGIEGKLVWIDKGKHTKPFFNQEYRVLGKPDLMYRNNAGIMAVEYKSRNANIYESDIIQGLTASLAARGNGFNVQSLLIKTDKNERFMRLPRSDNELFRMVQKQVSTVRKAKSGASLPSNPHYYKCLHCAYSESCTKK